MFSQHDNLSNLLYKGLYGDVIEILEEKLIATDSLSEDEYYNLGICYLKLMNYSKAIHIFNLLNKREPENTAYLIALGNSFTASENYHSAKIIFEKILKLDPTNLRALINLGKILIDSGEFSEATSVYKQLILVDSLNSYFYAQLGLCSYRINKTEMAEMNLKKSLSLGYTNPKIFLILSKIYFDEERLDKSAEVLKIGREFNPGSKKLTKMLADVHYKQKNYPECILEYLLTIALGDTTASTYQKLGMAYYYLSFTDSFINSESRDMKLNEGIAALKKAAKLRKNDPVNSLYLGLCFNELDSTESAVEYLEESLKNTLPDYLAEIYYHLGLSYDKQNKCVESIKSFKKSINSNPSKSIVYFHLANLYDRYYEDKTVAVLYYKKFISQNIEVDEKLIAYSETRINDLNRELEFWNR